MIYRFNLKLTVICIKIYASSVIFSCCKQDPDSYYTIFTEKVYGHFSYSDSQRPAAPQGSESPVEVTGRPISSERTEPPNCGTMVVPSM